MLATKGNRFYGIYQVIYTIYPNCMTDIVILAQSVLLLFCSQVSFTTQYAKIGKGDNSVKYLQKFDKSKLYAIHNMPKSERGIIQSNIYRILAKANCMPYIMIQAQALIQIL